MFDFTHNDLHTSNIMFKKTDKQYLYYKYDKIHYKVPTFGKIWRQIFIDMLTKLFLSFVTKERRKIQEEKNIYLLKKKNIYIYI